MSTGVLFVFVYVVELHSRPPDKKCFLKSVLLIINFRKNASQFCHITYNFNFIILVTIESLFVVFALSGEKKV